MPTLIENILSIEARASELVAKAHTDAVALGKRADDEIVAVRKALAAETDAKLAALENATEARCKRDLADVDAEYQSACAAIDNISSVTIQEQAAKIAAAFTQA